MLILLLMGKRFGMSSNLRTFCAACGAGKTTTFFRFDWKNDRWNLLIVAGAIIGGYVASNYMSSGEIPVLNKNTLFSLQQLKIATDNSYLPQELFSIEALQSVKSIVLLFVGGLFIGFGARYAGGCTSGHAISGLSNLQIPSLIAVIGFFIGGLIMVHLLFPLIFLV